VTIPAGGRALPDLAAITRAASREAGDVPASLLGDYLDAVLGAARTGRRLSAAELAGYRAAGARAAEGGVALRGLVDLYLSATWRLWRELPGTADSAAALRAAGLAVLRGADDAVAAAADGFERAILSVARRQEAERLEFFEDLLAGRGGLTNLVIRGERLGLRLAGPQQVVLAGNRDGSGPALPPAPDLARIVASAADPAPSLTAARGGQLVAITGAPDGDEARRIAGALGRAIAAGEPARSAGRSWRIAIGRPYPGPSGVLRSYAEAADALAVAERLQLPDLIADAGDLASTRCCSGTARPWPTWCRLCSARCGAPAAGPERCWPPWMRTSPPAGSRRPPPGSSICRCGPSPTGWPGSRS
jgi:GGDEF-like domain